MIHVDVSARLHDEARVVSANFEMELSSDADKLIAAMVSGMEETNRWAEKNDVFIGHVKGFVTWDEDKAVMISTVGEAVEVKGSEDRPQPPCTVKVGTANIVFGIDLHQVEERVMDFVSQLMAQFGELPEFHCQHEDDCECGCHGHEHHHHEHGDDCDCGCHDHEHHEHEHGHHHDHDEHCDCGCHDHEHHEHEHEHHHDHDEHCDCGCHDHEHHHHEHHHHEH